MTIELNSPHSEKFLRTSDDKAGQTAKCPGCGELITIPSAGELVHADPVQAEFADDAPAGSEERKPCPLCGELILKQARKCRYCGEEIGGGVREDVEKDPNSLELSDVLSASWELFKQHMGVSIGGLVLAGILQYIPFLGFGVAVQIADHGGPDAKPIAIATAVFFFLIGIIVSVYLSCGVTRLYLNIAYDREPRIGDLFSMKINTMLSWLAASLIQTLCMLALIWTCIGPIFLGLMWMPLHWLIVDQQLGPIAALSEAKRLTDGHKLNVFLVMLVGYLIGTAGAMACYVGMLFTMPLMLVIYTMLYVRLKARAGVAPAPIAEEA
jgi:hypothetical protein